MIKFTKRAVIAAPPEKVFDILDDPNRLQEIWPNLSNVRNVKRLPNGGHSLDFDYRMAGFRVEGTSVDLENSRPYRMVSRTTGGVTSTLTWDLRANSDSTEVSVDVEYEVPVPLIGKLAEMVIAKMNENDIEAVLNYLKLKAIME